MSKPLICEPHTWNFIIPIEKSIICHDIRDQNVSKKSKFAVNPCTHNSTHVCFEHCTFYQFPSASSIIDHCPQITMLLIQDSKLSRIEAEDLNGFKSLKTLHIASCDIEHLPGDLFKYTLNLEIISFYGNKIKSVGEDLLTPLQSLKRFNLERNAGIDYCFNSFINQGTLQELKEKLKEMKSNSELRNEIVALNTRCKKLEDHLKESNDKIETLKVEKVNLNIRCKKLEDQLKESNDKIETLKVENGNLNNRCKKLEDHLKESRDENKEVWKSIDTLRKQVVQLQEAAMNFVVIVNGKEFKSQKQVLKAHSKVIEKLIDENPDSESLELTNLSEAVFAEIHNFMHFGYPPNENVDLIELFGVSCRLEIEALTPIIARILKDKVNPENALKVLVLCNKYKNHEQLKAKAFDEFQKKIPYKIKPELASDPEALIHIFQTMGMFVAD